MKATLIVEPEPGGHHFGRVADVIELIGGSSEVVLLTKTGATETEAFRTCLDREALQIEEPFDEIRPPTRTLARAVAEQCRKREVETVVVMDADQALKRWWYVARDELRGLSPRPRIVFMLTRYPAKLSLTDRFGWKLRLSKGALCIAAMATGTLDRVAGFAGRDDMSKGWLVQRARDPATCSSHSSDRVRIRAELGLPQDRRLAGIFGMVTERKNAPMVLDAILNSNSDADLVIAGNIDAGTLRWSETLPEDLKARVVVREGFLSEEALDQFVAAVDVHVLALTNNGPSGIMGKALAADVPVVTAGSKVRARELRATDGGEVAGLTVASMGAAIDRVFARDPSLPRQNTVPPATGATFAATLLDAPPAHDVAPAEQRHGAQR